MPGVNLTRDEAAMRSSLVKTHSYRIDLDLTTSAETFIAKTCVKFSGLKPGQSTFIDALGKRVISASLNGVAFEVDRKSTRLNSSHDQIGRASCRERV